MARTAGTPSTVLVTLAALNAALGSFPNQKIPVNRKWIKTAEEFLGVKIPVEGAPVVDEDETEAKADAVRPTIGEH